MEQHEALKEVLLIHGDNALILSQRLGEWCGHGPVLEQDIAMTNIALDYVGRSRFFYQYAAELFSPQTSEDALAFLREESEYKNILLCEYPNTDFAFTVVRQFLLDCFYFYFFENLQNSSNKKLAEIAEKCFKESAYHLKWSSDWVLRLGDGTNTSHDKIQYAINELWRFSHEFFVLTESEKKLIQDKILPDHEKIKVDYLQRVKSVIQEATLDIPDESWIREGGKRGIHTEHMGYLLSDMQYMQRTYPGMEW